MQAEGIREGDRYDGEGGWTATGDAEVRNGRVYVPVVYHEGHSGTLVRNVGQQVPLSFGAGPATLLGVNRPRFPEGTPEYDAYATELREELRKWVAGEGEYAQPGACRVCAKPVRPGSELHDSCAGFDKPEQN